MLPYALGLGAACLAVLVYRHLRGRRAPILIGLTVVLLLSGSWVEYRWRAQQGRYSVALRELLGRDDAYVHCERLSAALLDASGNEGSVTWTADGSLPRRADLTWSTCRNLAKWERSGQKASAPRSQIIAVHVLAHEAMHVSGVMDEAEAECRAMQYDARLAELLGADPDEAAALAERYWREVYPNARTDYRSPGCAPGRALDLHPETSAWPSG